MNFLSCKFFPVFGHQIQIPISIDQKCWIRNHNIEKSWIANMFLPPLLLLLLNPGWIEVRIPDPQLCGCHKQLNRVLFFTIALLIRITVVSFL